MNGNEICCKCENLLEDENYFECDSCGTKIHKDCAELSASETKCMPLQRRKLTFLCKNCKTIMKKLPLIMTTLEELKQDVKAMKSKLDKMDISAVRGKSFAEIVSETKKDKTNIPCLLIKPKEGQNVNQTTKDIQKKIKPSEIKIGVKSMKPTKTGNLLIRCETKEDIEILKQTAEKTLTNDYEINTTKLKRPKIKIVNVKGNTTAEEVETKLRRQNSWLEEADDFKVTYIKKKKNNEATIFAECDPKTFNKFMKADKVYINWERYKVYEDISITRCFKCQAFFHKMNVCKNNVVCEICAQDHESENCKNNYKCNNCSKANQKYNLTYDINHSTYDKNCPSYKYHMEILRSKIDYHQK